MEIGRSCYEKNRQQKSHFVLHEVTHEAKVNRKQDGMMT